MAKRNTTYRLLLAFVMVLASVSVWSLAAAQEATPDAAQEAAPDSTQTPIIGVVLNSSEANAVVSDVMSDSPADEAGLQAGDVITAINGTDVTADTIRETLAGYAVGDEISLSVQRGDESLELTLTLAAAPEAVPDNHQRPDRPYLGISLDDGENGVVIREVAADSPAASAGLQVDDIITKVNDTAVSSAREVVEAIRGLNVGESVTLEVQRGDETQTITATLGSAPTNNGNGAPQQPIPFGGREGRELGFSYNPTDQTWTINKLSEGSPLYAAGLREGDVIQQFDGQTYDLPGLIPYLIGLDADATITLTVERDGETQDIDVPVSALTDLSNFGMGFGGNDQGQGFVMPFGMMQGGRLGVQFVTLDEQTAQEHNVTQTEGALVTDVVADSPAATAGLEVNDIIMAVDGDQVDAEHTLRDRLAAYEPEDTVTLDVQRGDQTMQIDVTLGQPEMGDFMPFGQDGMPFFGPDGGQNGPNAPQQPPVPQQPDQQTSL